MAEIDASVVRSYDIRGTVPDQIDAEFAYLFGSALPAVLGAERAVIGYDSRLSSEELSHWLVAGLREGGAQVRSLGLCPTELVYFASGARDFDLGVMVTASHNPPRYNGFKVTGRGGVPITGESGLREVCRRMQSLQPGVSAGGEPAEPLELMEEYFDFVFDLVGAPPVPATAPLVDAGNGVGGLLWQRLSGRLGCEPVRLNFEPDGNFPAHEPDPSREENLRPLIRDLRRRGADVGFCYDGDADRVVVVLGDGHVVDGSEMTGCIAARLLQQRPDAVFGVGQTTSRKTLDYFRERGVRPVITPVGHSKIKNVLRAHPSMVFAGEHAGHYYYRDFFHCDSSLITTLHLLHLVGRGTLTAQIEEFAGPWHRVNDSVRFDDQSVALQVCRQAARRSIAGLGEGREITVEREGAVLRECSPSEIEGADSVRVDYDQWWFCVRPSGTEPIARLAVEARTREEARQRLGELRRSFERLKEA